MPKYVSRITRRLACAVLLLCAFSATSLHAQVLNQVPADALVVVKVKNLKATSDKIAKLATDWGLAQVQPDFADPLAAFKKELTITNGLDDNGDMGVVFTDFEPTGKIENTMILLLPVADFKAFVANFADAKEASPGIMQASVGVKPEQTFMAKWGNFAALSGSQDMLKKKPAGLKVTGVSAKELEAKDICAFGNMPAISAKYLPKLQAQREKILAKVDAHIAAEPSAAKWKPVAHAAANRALDIAEGFMRDAHGATYGWSFLDTGIRGTAEADFGPDTYSARLVKQIKNSNASLLAGLPQEKYLFLIGMMQDPKVTQQIVTDLLTPVEKELTDAGDDMKPVLKYLAVLKKACGTQSGGSYGVVAPTAALGVEPLLQLVGINHADVKAFKALQKEMTAAQAEMVAAMKPAPAADDATTKPAASQILTPNAKTVAGVNFDEIKQPVEIDPQNPQEAQIAAFLGMIYGPDGMVLYSGAIDDRHLLVVSGLKDEVIAKAVASAKAADDAIAKSATIDAVNAQLPKERVVAYYIPLDNIINTGVNYAKQNGLPVNLQPFQHSGIRSLEFT